MIKYEARSVCVPSIFPGYIRFMFLPSVGLRCGTTFWNDGTLTSGRMITVPESCFASISAISFSSAMIDAYSVPWAPASSASTGPALAPCATAIGIDVAASLPAGTSIAPVAVMPRDAFTLPTVNTARSPARLCPHTGETTLSNRQAVSKAHFMTAPLILDP